MEEIKYNVRVKGISPLLMNRYIEGTIEATRVRKGVAKQIDPEDKIYKDKDGKPYIPSTYILGALVEAGKSVQIQGKKRSTYSKLIGSTVSVFPDAILLNPSAWEVFTITGVNPTTRGRMSISRPKFDEWGLDFEITTTDDIPEDKLEVIIAEAGRFVGIGDWRPQKKGRYGKFMIEHFKRVD